MKIDSYTKLIEVLTLQVANLPTYMAAVGATAADLAEIEDDLNNLTYMLDYADLVDANKQAVTKIKQALYNGEESEPVSAFPVFPAGNPPKAILAGAYQRAIARNKRFKAAAGYTKEIGIALGIDDESSSINPDLVKPTIQAFSAQTGYMYSVVVGNRGDSTMWDVWELRKGAVSWSKVDSFQGKSGDVHATPTTAGNAEQFQIRVQLRKNNQNYGIVSDIVYVTINP